MTWQWRHSQCRECFYNLPHKRFTCGSDVRVRYVECETPACRPLPPSYCLWLTVEDIPATGVTSAWSLIKTLSPVEKRYNVVLALYTCENRGEKGGKLYNIFIRNVFVSMKLTTAILTKVNSSKVRTLWEENLISYTTVYEVELQLTIAGCWKLSLRSRDNCLAVHHPPLNCRVLM